MTQLIDRHQLRPHCTVYFDGSCPICAGEIAGYRHLSGAAADRPRFVDISAEDGKLPPGLDRQAALNRFHIELASGQLASGAAAFIALWQVTPGLRLLGRIAALPPIPWFLEGVYRCFLVLRPLWRRSR